MCGHVSVNTCVQLHTYMKRVGGKLVISHFGHYISFDKFLALLMLIIFLTKRQCRVFHQVLQATIPASFSHVWNLKMKQHITVWSLLFGNRSKGPIPGSAWIPLICWLIFSSFSLSETSFYSRSEGRLIHYIRTAWLTVEKETKTGKWQIFKGDV